MSQDLGKVAIIVRDEKKEGENTANRIGEWMYQVASNLDDIKQNFSNTKNNVYNRLESRNNLIVENSFGNIITFTNGTSVISGYINIPDNVDTIYSFSDQSFNSNGNPIPMNSVLKNDTDDSSGGLFIALPIDGSVSITRGAYKYLIVTVARDPDSSHVFDLSKIRIGFTESYKKDTFRDNLIDVRQLSDDFNCFQKYKNDGSDKMTANTNILCSQVYRAFVSLKLYGFEVDKIYKIFLVRRNWGTTNNYNIVVGVYDEENASWVRDTYFITDKNIETGNVGGINTFDVTIGSKRMVAEIDYSFLPDNTSNQMEVNEADAPNFIIKKECYTFTESLLSNVVVDLPISDGSDIKQGYPYIDSITGQIIIKV